jgi:hypothetical protein
MSDAKQKCHVCIHMRSISFDRYELDLDDDNDYV